MKIEKWKLDDKEIEVPIVDADEIEVNDVTSNENISDEDLDKTAELIFDLESEDDKNGQY